MILPKGSPVRWGNSIFWPKTRNPVGPNGEPGKSGTESCYSNSSAVPARPRRRPEVSPLPPTVRRRRSDRPTTLRRPQNVGQRHVSPSAARSSAFRTVCSILVATSGELILLPVGCRHPILNLGRRPLARYSDFDIPPSSSRTYPAYRTFQVQNGG